MEIGITGLGRMGAGMAERWLRGGHRVVANNRSREPIDELAVCFSERSKFGVGVQCHVPSILVVGYEAANEAGDIGERCLGHASHATVS